MAAQVASEPDQLELPQAGTWQIDRGHTAVEFATRHMLTKVRGRFEDFSGWIRIGESQQDSAAEVDIVASSLTSNNDDRDGDLKSPNFLDVERFPELTFRSREVRLGDANRFQLIGDLTIRDVTREVVLDAEYLGTQADPFGNSVAGFSAATRIDREDFGMTWNVAIEAGGVLVGKQVDIQLEIEARLQADSA